MTSPVAPEPAAMRPRVAGVTIPLFAIRTRRSWGIGEIPDLVPFADWIATAGISLVQLLPLGEISGGETSPYSALSAFGIDPTYVAVDQLEDLPEPRLTEAIGGAAGLAALEGAKRSATVDYGTVRRLKALALRAAFTRFRSEEWDEGTARAERLRAFLDAHASWIGDYALYRAVKDAHDGGPWWQWDEPLRDRDPRALDEARKTLEGEILHHAYVQWIAHEQWAAARSASKSRHVELMGDLPFMVGRDSADVWAERHEFRDDASVGVPPDLFDAEGQDWDLPPYDWDRMRAGGYAWLRRRARYVGSLYDRFRIDHLVGFYRTYSRPRDARRDAKGKLVGGTFDPEGQSAQLAHGERVVGAMIEGAREQGAQLVAEDLGVVPDFVRASLTRLGVPGYRVLIWEKDGAVFRDPAAYPRVSVACFGTHDTAPVAAWWEALDRAERQAVLAMPGLSERAAELTPAFTEPVHRALVDLLNGAASELVLFLIQDVLGSKERINTPATVGAHNWSYRLPSAVEDLASDAGSAARMRWFAESVRASGRR